MARDDEDGRLARLHVHPCMLPVSRPDSGEEACPRGLAGRALCFVNGPLLKGDLFSCLPSWEWLALGLTRFFLPEAHVGRFLIFLSCLKELVL